MWKCKVCDSKVEDDTWTECWKCGSHRGAGPVEVKAAQTQISARLEKAKTLECLRCHTPLRFLGTKKFHEGTRQWGFWLGDLGELFVNRQAFDVFACPHCGKVEFFVDGIGEELRKQK